MIKPGSPYHGKFCSPTDSMRIIYNKKHDVLKMLPDPYKQKLKQQNYKTFRELKDLNFRSLSQVDNVYQKQKSGFDFKVNNMQ